MLTSLNLIFKYYYYVLTHTQTSLQTLREYLPNNKAHKPAITIPATKTKLQVINILSSTFPNSLTQNLLLKYTLVQISQFQGSMRIIIGSKNEDVMHQIGQMRSKFLPFDEALSIQGFILLRSDCHRYFKYKRVPKGQWLLLMESQKQPEQKHQKYTVSVRIKPNLTNQPPCLAPYKSKYIKETRPKSIVTYGFDRVFDQNHDNAYIYDESLRKTVQFFMHKKISTTILAYGQTGSGKTYTLFGHKQKDQKGLIYHIVDDVIKFTQSRNISVKCSFMQIYKEKVSDLMTSANIQLKQNGNGDLFLQNLKVYEVQSKEQLVQLLEKAHSNKIFGNSYINSESSRSHVIFTLELQKKKLNIVDLCGSEVLTYQFNQQQREETNSINLSLFTLNAVVNDLAFAQKAKNKFIPFRNSVLTRILKESLLDIDKSQIYLFCNVSPQAKHQNFSANTLRFGQLAIKIDEANNVVEEKVNLSQQKRQKKMVSNIVDITPEQNKSAGTYKIDWNTYFVKILGKNTKIYSLLNPQANCDVLILHAYGYGCCGDDWNLHISYLAKKIKANIYSVDFPGFGESEGKKFTSRAQKFQEEGQPIEFMSKLFQVLGFSPKNKVILMGYDLGGAIALSCAINRKLSKAIQLLAAFHPTWTDKVQRLAEITVPTLLIWFPVETFHLVSAGQKMAKLIKNSRLYRLNVGPYTNQKAGGYYDTYSEEIQTIVADFISQKKPDKGQPAQEGSDNRGRGGIIQQNIEVNFSKEQEDLKNGQQSVLEVFKLKELQRVKQIYESLIKGGADKPKYVRLAGLLPDIQLSKFDWTFCQKYLLFTKIPKNPPNFDQFPFFLPHQQLQVRTKINLNALSPAARYLAFDKNGENGITHKAYVDENQTQEQILEKQTIKVSILDVEGKNTTIQVDLNEVLYLNSPTVYKKNHLGQLLFEDSVTCNYSSSFVKLKIVECCYLLQPIVSQMNFSSNDDILLHLQKKCAKIIYQQIDLRHLVHEGIDNTRYTGIDVGRLAYYGQGNCHHLASVTAALLIPFGKLLGWEIIFRAGSFFKTGRELDQEGNPAKGWNGKPNVNVEDHTWLQIRYKPSNSVFVFDPSFAICSSDLDEIYSFEGKMHISGKKLNFALDYEPPMKLWAK